MTEWGVVGVVVVLVGLVASIVGPVLRLNTSITKLTVTLDNTCADITETRADIENIKDKSAERAKRLWDKNEQQDKTLTDHEKRIHVLERKNDG